MFAPPYSATTQAQPQPHTRSRSRSQSWDPAAGLGLPPRPEEIDDSSHWQQAMRPTSPMPADQRAQPMNSITKHPKVKLEVYLDQPAYQAGTAITGTIQVTSATSNHLRLGEIAVELEGFEELSSRDHSATQTFLYNRTLFQGHHLPPSNAVLPTSPTQGYYWTARKGKTTFPFTFRIPSSIPSSVTFSGNASIKYVIKATVQTWYQDNKTIVTTKNTANVLEQWQDEHLEEYYTPVEKIAESKLFMGGQGSVWLEAYLDRQLFMSTDEISSSMKIAIRNASKRDISGLKIDILRSLSTGHNNAIPATGTGSGPIISEVIHTRQYKVDFPSNSEIVLNSDQVQFDIPLDVRTIRKTRLFEIEIALLISVSLGTFAKDLQIKLPIFAVHPLSLQPNGYYFQQRHNNNITRSMSAMGQQQMHIPRSLSAMGHHQQVQQMPRSLSAMGQHGMYQQQQHYDIDRAMSTGPPPMSTPYDRPMSTGPPPMSTPYDRPMSTGPPPMSTPYDRPMSTGPPLTSYDRPMSTGPAPMSTPYDRPMSTGPPLTPFDRPMSTGPAPMSTPYDRPMSTGPLHTSTGPSPYDRRPHSAAAMAPTTQAQTHPVQHPHHSPQLLPSHSPSSPQPMSLPSSPFPSAGHHMVSLPSTPLPFTQHQQTLQYDSNNHAWSSSQFILPSTTKSVLPPGPEVRPLSPAHLHDKGLSTINEDPESRSNTITLKSLRAMGGDRTGVRKSVSKSDVELFEDIVREEGTRKGVMEVFPEQQPDGNEKKNVVNDKGSDSKLPSDSNANANVQSKSQSRSNSNSNVQSQSESQTKSTSQSKSKPQSKSKSELQSDAESATRPQEHTTRSTSQGVEKDKVKTPAKTVTSSEPRTSMPASMPAMTTANIAPSPSVRTRTLSTPTSPARPNSAQGKGLTALEQRLGSTSRGSSPAPTVPSKYISNTPVSPLARTGKLPGTTPSESSTSALRMKAAAVERERKESLTRPQAAATTSLAPTPAAQTKKAPPPPTTSSPTKQSSSLSSTSEQGRKIVDTQEVRQLGKEAVGRIDGWLQSSTTSPTISGRRRRSLVNEVVPPAVSNIDVDTPKTPSPSALLTRNVSNSSNYSVSKPVESSPSAALGGGTLRGTVTRSPSNKDVKSIANVFGGLKASPSVSDKIGSRKSIQGATPSKVVYRDIEQVDSGAEKASVDSKAGKASMDSRTTKSSTDSKSAKASADSQTTKSSADSKSAKASVESASSAKPVAKAAEKPVASSGVTRKLTQTFESAAAAAPTSSEHDNAPRHDVRSIRGGRGGRVASAASLWASIANGTDGKLPVPTTLHEEQPSTMRRTMVNARPQARRSMNGEAPALDFTDRGKVEAAIRAQEGQKKEEEEETPLPSRAAPKAIRPTKPSATKPSIAIPSAFSGHPSHSHKSSDEQQQVKITKKAAPPFLNTTTPKVHLSASDFNSTDDHQQQVIMSGRGTTRAVGKERMAELRNLFAATSTATN
ncbi:unnamed protein product [Sympodiomycopsis kandeliae]